MTDLHQKLSTLQGLLPSQRKWLDRLVFQLDFNPYQFICLVGGPGSGKTTVALAIADLLSDEYNLALLTAEANLRAPQIRQHLLEQWFGYGMASDKTLLELCADRPSPQPLALIIDQSELLPKELWPELDEMPCLVIATALTDDAHAELNLPLSPPTMEDAAVLLQDQQFSTLTMAERLELAAGNLHVLLDPKQARQQQRTTNQPAPVTSLAAPLWTFTIGMAAILAVIVFWFWTERQMAPANGLGELTYLPEEQEVIPTLPAQQAAAAVSAKKQVVEQLVDQLEQVKADKADVATLERPSTFDEAATTPADAERTPAVQHESTEQTAAAEPAAAATEAATQQAKAPESDQTAAQLAGETVVPTATPVTADDNTSQPAAAEAAPVASEDDLAAELLAEQQAASSKAVTPAATVTGTAAEPDDLAAEVAAERGAAQTTAELQPVTPSAENTAAAARTAIERPFDANALLALPANQYALQLVVFSNPAALNSFRQSYPQLNTLVYQRQKDGKRQLVVVQAPFDSAAAAKAQARQLPAPLQQGFAKSLADIHADISAN
jgi:septal ring-binding cell division protein DamX